MNILLQQGGHDFVNLGDLAMLQVTVRRFRESSPNCIITVLSNATIDPGEYVYNTSGVDVQAVSRVFGPGCLFGRASRRLGTNDSAIVTRYPVLMHGVALRHRLRGQLSDPIASFIRALSEADIVAASGGGYLTDEFPFMVEQTAWLLLAAQRMGKRTALFGQGIGPLNNPRLRSLLAQVVRNIEVVGFREGVLGPTLMQKLGLDRSKCIVTGDDALELPYAAVRARTGKKLGVNLRRASYSGISTGTEGRLSKVLSQLLTELQTSAVVIPIDVQENDAEVGAELLGQASVVSPKIEVPDVIRIASECRVVITGSYHAAVFALGQGIPSVCLVGSDYYRNKFIGLADQFSSGCLVVETNSEGFEKNVADSAMSLWRGAEALRSPLLESAKVQVERSRSLYRTFAHDRLTSGSRATKRARVGAIQ
jgi:polysaccharide pyruvyl transferase WcaK-like protein